MKRIYVIVVICATALAAFTTTRLEYLNARANYKLPMDDVKAASRAVGGSGAWRASRMDETKWRTYNITHFGEKPDRPLTAEEQAEMEKHIQSSNANADLRDFVASICMFHYPLLIFTILLSSGLLTVTPRTRVPMIVGATALFISLACLGLTVYRGPFRALMD